MTTSQPPSTMQIPTQYLCPITGALMVDPVIDREGNSYERTAIEEWLARNPVSPITRSPLHISDLTPNRALRDAIEAFQGRDAPAVATPTQPQPPAQTQPESRGHRQSVVTANDLGLRFVHDPEARCLLSLTPPERPRSRAPLDIVCVIDVSGSMSTNATVQDDKGKAESHGLTILDVVTHAANTVANMLGEDDRFAVVTFSDTAKVVMPLGKMTAAGKKKAGEVLKALTDGGRTNLWGGLVSGMEALLGGTDGARESTGRNKTVLLLTDGCPNVEPPRGHLPSLRNYIDKLGTVPPFTINTFGFGYSLDSKLLHDIAAETGGMYVFIPDSGLVGTVFVNCVANLLATAASAVHVSVELSGPGSVLPSLLQTTSFGATGRIGSLIFGQTRDLCLQLDPKTLVAGAPFAKVDVNIGGTVVTLTAECQQASEAERATILAHDARNAFVASLSGTEHRGEMQRATAEAARALKPKTVIHPLIEALHQDLTGEVAMGLSKDDLYTKWGVHYLPSLRRANELQQCNNFKDKSVQLYGAAYFREVRDAGEAVFVALPPPVSRRPQFDVPRGLTAVSGGRGGGRGGAAAPSQPRPAPNMRAYYNCGGGCVAPSCLVALADGSTKPAAAVQKGDVLANGAVVRCNVNIQSERGNVMVHLKGGLVISPYHPIRLPLGGDATGEWIFPCDAVARDLLDGFQAPLDFAVEAADEEERPQYIHSFVLEKAFGVDPVITVNGVEIASLGHGLATSSVIAHDYLGTDRVVDDLRKLDGFETEGRVTVKGFTRDAGTNRIVGLQQ